MSAAVVVADDDDLQLHQVCALSMVSPLPADADGAAAARNEEDADLSPWSLNTFNILPTK
eukprot:scaffold3183_cov146-Skeletonema_marinoi.AAC.3